MEVWPKITLLLFSIALFINGTLFIPQVIKIIRQNTAKELSLITFAGFNLMQLITIIHGYNVKDYILMIGMAYSFVTCGMVSILIIYFKMKGQ